VGDSPVVPPTTMPRVPAATWNSSRRDQASKSRAPSARMGVTIAT
jgi:hypothetical protein